MAKYVIVEESWEYNDEYYYQSDSGGYNIKSKLYTDETLNDAKVEVDRLNAEIIETNSYFRTEDFESDEGDVNGGYIKPFKIVKIKE
jgi:hypothetical protein